MHTPGLCRHTQACPHSQGRNPRVPVPQGPCKCTSPSPLLQALPSGCRIAQESPAVGPGSKVKEIPTRQMDLVDLVLWEPPAITQNLRCWSPRLSLKGQGLWGGVDG